MPSEKELNQYLRRAYFMPQRGGNIDASEFTRFLTSDEKILDVAKRLNMTWPTAQAMLERGRYIQDVRNSTASRQKRGEQLTQWAILIPNAHFYALCRDEIYHPDQLIEVLADQVDATAAQTFALLETFKTIKRVMEA